MVIARLVVVVVVIAAVVVVVGIAEVKKIVEIK